MFTQTILQPLIVSRATRLKDCRQIAFLPSGLYTRGVTGQDLGKFWREGSADAWQTAQALVNAGRFLHALFFCHLTLEKLLKARYIEHHQQPAPPVHNLVWLAEQAGVALDDATREGLAQIAKFNIAGRYEDYKDDLRRQATAEYTNAWLEKTEAWRKLLAGEYHA